MNDKVLAKALSGLQVKQSMICSSICRFLVPNLTVAFQGTENAPTRGHSENEISGHGAVHCWGPVASRKKDLSQYSGGLTYHASPIKLVNEFLKKGSSGM